MEDIEGNSGTTKSNKVVTEKRSVSISTVRGNKIDPREPERFKYEKCCFKCTRFVTLKTPVNTMHAHRYNR